MELGIRGRVAIVTGGSKGIGAATVRRLSAEGVSVVLGARDRAPLDALVESVRADGCSAVGVEIDVLDRSSASVLREAALDTFGRVDIVVNNAGGGGPA